MKVTHSLFSLILSFALLNSPVSAGDAFHLSDTDRERLESKIQQSLNREVKVDEMGLAPINGFYYMVVANEVIYYHEQDEVIFIGTVLKKNGENVTQALKERAQAKKIATLPMDQALVIGDGPNKIIEFTDPDCPYCQKAHRFLKPKSRLSTRYIFFSPIEKLHPEARHKVVHIFCSDDPVQAFHNILERRVAFADLIDCHEGQRKASAHQKISSLFGVSGTPTMVLGKEVVPGFSEKRLTQYLNSNVIGGL